jgi:PAS domain S-box-containing protein
MNTACNSILIVDGTTEISEIIRQTLAAADPTWEIRLVDSLSAYREAVATVLPDIVLLELNLPDGRALEILTTPADAGLFPVIIMTDSGSEQEAVEAIKAGALDYVIKSPEAFAAMPRVVGRALWEWRLIQERRQIEATLRDNERAAYEAIRRSDERFRKLVDTVSNISVQGYGPDGTVRLWNKASEVLYGYTAEEAVGRNLVDLIIPSEMREPVRTAIREMVETCEGHPAEELLLVRKDGSPVPVYSNHTMVEIEGVGRELYCIDIDLTARKQAEESVRASLHEKEAMLKEIHHRVKNNMQIISSLLNLQANAKGNELLKAEFQDSQNRIRAMALVHEKLYNSENLATIDFDGYLRDLTAQIFRSYRGTIGNISLSCAAPGIFFGIDTAVPCGLVVSELVTNALKHAFPDGRDGAVRVDLKRSEDGGFNLMVADNGVGLPEGFDPLTAKTLGMQLIRNLALQLGGVVDCSSTDGALFRITFTG